MNPTEDRAELQRVFKEGIVTQLSEYKIRILWNQIGIFNGFEMPRIEAFLLKNEYIDRIRELIVKTYDDQLLKQYIEGINKEYNLKDGWQLGKISGICIPLKEAYLLAIAERPSVQTIEEIIKHELRHVVELEIRKRQLQGYAIKANGKTLESNETYLINHMKSE